MRVKNTLNENILHVFAAWIEYLVISNVQGAQSPCSVFGATELRWSGSPTPW